MFTIYKIRTVGSQQNFTQCSGDNTIWDTRHSVHPWLKRKKYDLAIIYYTTECIFVTVYTIHIKPQ